MSRRRPSGTGRPISGILVDYPPFATVDDLPVVVGTACAMLNEWQESVVHRP